MARLRMPLLSILVTMSFVGCLFACQKKPVDQERDAMVGTFEQVQKVLMKELSCSPDRVMISSNLSLIGINEDNRMKVKSALEKEIGITIPENLLLERKTVGDIVRFAADRQLKDDALDKQLEKPLDKQASTSLEKIQSKEPDSKAPESKELEPKASKPKSPGS